MSELEPKEESTSPSNGWKGIWASKSEPTDLTASAGNDSVLSTLIRLNGFDTGCGDYSEAQWSKMVAGLAERARIENETEVLEVGCGCGALLYQLNTLTGCAVNGIDYSESLINSAKKHLSGRFAVSEARHLPFEAKSFVVVLSHSVFQYFPDVDYAFQVVGEMTRVLKPHGRLFLMDLNDKKFEEVYHSERKKNYSDPSEYERKYSGFAHLFFDKEALVEHLKTLGYVDVEFFPHDVPEYINSQFRFNLCATRGG